MKSIEMCINRFDSETKDAFLDLYTKIDESANLEEFIQEGETVENGGYDPKIDMP
jgi:hypothetical protein